jgi:tetratricopeptide (TPR) repeat protein
VGDPLGEGGMSQVVRAFDRARGEEVALKIVTSDSPAVVLSAEFRYIASLNHPGVVSVYDFGLADDGRPFFTMEMLADGDLLDVAERAGMRTMLRTAREVFRTLEFVHARGIVHADLKPSNIMLGRTRSGEHYPRLLDFGIAWEDADQQTGGTIAFMAPELLIRGRNRDHRSDLYSMGVVLFEMFTGELPFYDNDTMRLAQHHLTTPAPDPRDFFPKLPGAIAEMVLRLLEKSPNDRFASAREVVQAIDAHLAQMSAPKSTRRAPFVIADPEVRIAGASRYVGHNAELERVIDLSGSLEDGGAVVAISGEAGAGKTRMLSELRVAVQLRGIAWLGVDLAACRSGGEVVDRLAAALEAASDQELSGSTAVKSVEPVSGDDRLILDGERLAKDAVALARRRPLLIGIEGIDEVPTAGLRAVRAFAAGAASGPVLVVATARGGPEALRDLLTIDAAEQIELRRVSHESCGEIIGSLLGEMDGADAIVEHVYRESGGNPGAMERVVHALVASDAIVLRRDSWVVAPELGGRLPVMEAEAGLRKIAASVVASLDDASLEIVTAAAHIGEGFDVSLVAALVPELDVQVSLNELVASEVLQPEQDGNWERYRFTQRATVEVLRQQLTAERAESLSLRIVTELEGKGTEPTTLARHLLHLGRAVEAAEVAARAMDPDANSELVEVVREALDATEESWESVRWCELASELAGVDRRRGRGDAAMAGYRRIEAKSPITSCGIAARCERGDMLMDAADEAGEGALREALADAGKLGDDALVARVAYTLANHLVLAGQHNEAARHVSDVLEASKRIGDHALRARTLKLCATLNWLRGRLSQSERYARDAVEVYRELDSAQGIAVSLGALANALYTQGDMDGARSAYTEALTQAHQARWLTGVGKLEASLAAVAYHVDDWDGAGEHQDAAIAILDRVGNRSDQVTQMQGRAFIALRRGESVAARTLYESALDLAQKAAYRKGEADVLSNLGELSLHVGALDEAAEYLERALPIARSIRAISAEIETERRQLELALARHSGPAPIVDKAQALLARAEKASLGTESLHIRLVAGVALARLREPDEAKRMLEQAHAGFKKLGSRYEAARTVRIMSELATNGQIIASDIEGKLSGACRVFRRLRAQPELDHARAIRERLGMPPSRASLEAVGTGAPHSTSLSTPPAPASIPPSIPSSDTLGTEPARLPSHARATAPPPRATATSASLPSPSVAPSLVELSRQLSETLDLDELLACIADAAIASSAAQRGFVIACDRAGQPALRVSRGLGGLDLDEDLDLSRSAVGRVIATRARVEWMADRPARPNALGESVFLLGLQSILALPMISRGKLCGVLYLDTRDADADLVGPSSAALEALAAHAAVAVDNARLFEELGRKNELLASAINELRHPLEVMQRCAEVAYQQSEGSATQRLNDTVRTQAKRLGVKVGRLLELATTAPSDVRSSKVSVQVRELVDAAMLQLRPIDDLGDTTVELDVPWGLPTVLGHREQLIQVIGCMLAAALRASPAGESVTLHARAVESPPSHDDDDPFFPPRAISDHAVEIIVRHPSSEHAGVDPLDELGLATAREIVEHHGGRWSAHLADGELVAILPSLVGFERSASAS